MYLDVNISLANKFSALRLVKVIAMWLTAHNLSGWIVGNPDFERQLSALELMNAATIALRRHCRNYGPIMVQQFFLSALKLLLGATRVA